MKNILTLFFILCSVKAFNQSRIESVLSEIERNNKTLISQRQYLEAGKLAYKTGLNPANPRVAYENLPGSPDGAGTQQDLSITQELDFPTSYAKRRTVSNEQIEKIEIEFNVTRQEILLEAKLSCIDYIHRAKLHTELTRRIEHANVLRNAFSRQTERGESNILDLNKVKLLLLEIQNQYELNQRQRNSLQLKLDELNGGNRLDLSALHYIPIGNIFPFDVLDSLIEANDPVVKSIRQDREVNREMIGLAKSLTLPKLEGGYHRQSILGQTYQGVRVGVTLPLWENKNRVKTEQARLSFAELLETEHRTRHFYENKQLYEEYLHWQKTFSEYQSILGSANNDELLAKALQAGQLSLIEYLMELRYFYDAISTSLEAERSLHQSITQLYKFQL